jgi:hypothetical protein
MSGFSDRRKLILPSKKIKDKRYNHTDKDASCQRKIKGKAFTLNINIPWQMAQPGELSGERNYDSEDD